MSAADILKSIAPTLATALAGPLAGAAVDFIAGKVGVPDATRENIHDIVSGLTPADRLKLQESDNEFRLRMADNGIRIDLAQVEVNAAEAKSANWFVAGWRPAVGWICAAALGYVAIIEPVARFIATVGVGYAGVFPAIDTTLTMQILLGMLGLGGMRTVEKVKGAEGNR